MTLNKFDTLYTWGYAKQPLVEWYRTSPITTNVKNSNVRIYPRQYICNSWSFWCCWKLEKQKNVFSNFKERLFADNTSGLFQVERFSIVPVKEKKAFWFGQFRLIFHAATQKNENVIAEFTFVTYFEVTAPLNNIDLSLKCKYLMWETYDDVDLTFEAWQYAEEPSKVVEWCGDFPFSSIRTVHQNMRSTYSVASFSIQIPWCIYRFNVNRLYKASQ